MIPLRLAWLAGALWVTVKGFHSAGGTLYIDVFDAAPGFPEDKSRAIRRDHAKLKRGAGSHRFRFEDLPPGRFAVSVFQDLDGDRRLKKGFLGIPKEPVGVSNNPSMRFGPPAFKDAAFNHGSDDTALTIRLLRETEPSDR